MSPAERFLRDLATQWKGEAVSLKVIGSAALMLQTDYRRGTRDSDVLETRDVTPTQREALLALAGRDSVLAQDHRMYLEFVQNGLPFLPMAPNWKHVDTVGRVDLLVLDVTDVVVSKFARYKSSDRDDVQAMVTGGQVEHAELVKRFQKAIESWEMDARAEDLPLLQTRFQRMERDLLSLPPTEFDLPSWV